MKKNKKGLEDNKKIYLFNLAYYSAKWFVIWAFRIFLILIAILIVLVAFFGSAMKETAARQADRGES